LAKFLKALICDITAPSEVVNKEVFDKKKLVEFEIKMLEALKAR